MKVVPFLAVASLVQAASTHAIRHKQHADRREIAPAIETVTTTFYQTVVWVNTDGEPVSTEINDPPTSSQLQDSETLKMHPWGLPGVTKPALPTDAASSSHVQSLVSSSHAWNAQLSSQASVSEPLNLPKSSEVPESTTDATEPTQEAATGGDTGDSSNGAVPGGMGICYDMINSQTQCKDPGTINTEFGFLKSQGYGIVRVYDIGCPVGDYTAAAAQNGLKVMVGINSIANLQGDLSTLIGMVGSNWGAVDTIYIGNELVNTGQASAGQIAGAVTTAKGILSGAGFSGSVITVDTFNVMMNDPTICSTSDYCGTNIHAFFDPNTAATAAGAFVSNAYNKVVSANPGKRIVITEAGWPYQGNANGLAVPSPENQATALASIQSAGIPLGDSIFMFQAYDAGYKAPGALGVEQYFGIYGHRWWCPNRATRARP